MIAIFHLQRGMPSKRKSSACIDYVPALCTHRPSLLPIEWSDENYGLGVWAAFVAYALQEVVWTLSFRGRRSRNKVSVGEPAEGSLTSSFMLWGLTATWHVLLCFPNNSANLLTVPRKALFGESFSFPNELTFMCRLLTQSDASCFFTPYQLNLIVTDWTLKNWASKLNDWFNNEQLLAVDILVLVTMKNAAKCDT